MFTDVPGLEWLFAVSRCGRVIRKGRETPGGWLDDRELKIRSLPTGGGYAVTGVRVAVNGKRKEFSLRRLLERTFGKPEKPQRHPARKPHPSSLPPEGEGRPVPGFPNYTAYENGSICGPRGVPMAQKQAGRYKSVCISVGAGKTRELKVHRLILETFVGPRPKGHVACHGIFGADDNSVKNLRWGTREENDEDRRLMRKLRNHGLL